MFGAGREPLAQFISIGPRFLAEIVWAALSDTEARSCRRSRALKFKLEQNKEKSSVSAALASHQVPDGRTCDGATVLERAEAGRPPPPRRRSAEGLCPRRSRRTQQGSPTMCATIKEASAEGRRAPCHSVREVQPRAAGRSSPGGNAGKVGRRHSR